MRRLSFLLLTSIVLIFIVPALVSADDSVSPSSNITSLVVSGGSLATQSTTTVDIGSSIDYTVSSNENAITQTEFYLDSNTEYSFSFIFHDGTILSGTMNTYPTWSGIWKETDILISGKWYNTSTLGTNRPDITFNTGISLMNNETYYYLIVFSISSDRRLELPVSNSMVTNPIVRFTMSSIGGQSFTYAITETPIANLVHSVTLYQQGVSSPIDQIAAFISAIYQMMMVGWVLIDFLIIKGYLLIIMVEIWQGMIAYYSNSSSDIFQFYKKSIKGTLGMFTFIYTTTYYIGMSLKAFVDLINPLKWLI
jgi:hypothetical protein